MEDSGAVDEQLRVLSFWRMVELFSPQRIPALTTKRASSTSRRTLEWRRGEPLPWTVLRPPSKVRGRPRVWKHTVYLGVYEVENTYRYLQRVFGQDDEAYEERPGGESACAGLLIDQQGHLVPGSAVLSSALWGIGRSLSLGPGQHRWLEGFDETSTGFSEAVERFGGLRCDDPDAVGPTVQDAGSIQDLLEIAHSHAGVTGLDELATDRVVIESVVVQEPRQDQPPAIDFLNSFYLDDLAMVRDRIGSDGGAALNAYLTSDSELSLLAEDRIDVVHEPETVDDGTAIERLPSGRWPANPAHALALSQQFAVNEAMNVLGPAAGLMGVNGPPGTGKTTMLRDVLAANVVERALRLSRLESAQDAFTDVVYRWSSDDGHRQTVRGLVPELTGFEMVVASANNGAVENVTNEIPASNSIHESWWEQADYFSEVATRTLRAAQGDGGCESAPPEAWGLTAARLGNRHNRWTFHSAFWFDEFDPETGEKVEGIGDGMQTLLKRWESGEETHRTWAEARRAFATARQNVETLIELRRSASNRLRRSSELSDLQHSLTSDIEAKVLLLEQAERTLADQESAESKHEADRARLAGEYDRHLAARPGALETLLSLGGAIREWRTGLRSLSEKLQDAERHHRESTSATAVIRQELERVASEQAAASGHLDDVRRESAELSAECRRDEQRYGDGYPRSDRAGKQRELRAPWLDAELDAARSELFLAALDLHRDFLANTAGDMRKYLRAAGDVITGSCPRALEPEKRWAAWRAFFLVVPLVSTTFASMGRMFGDIGSEAIGWLMVDEAGQASPQCAVGAIWRARRVLAVGDPQQLEPVVSIPQKTERDIASHYGISVTWVPSRASVQTLADRVVRHGTYLKRGEGRIWVSAPLRVHRRCDEPMFNLCNRIAYDGIMVNGVQRDQPDLDRFASKRVSDPIHPSDWVDVPATEPGSHLQAEEINRFIRIVDYLERRGVPAAEIIAISPFRAVADRLSEVAADRCPGLRAGTIHTAQGKEGQVVILVLGGDPRKPGAKSWAASTPNIVNVAASRAQRRLYVIGDLAAWKKYPYFRDLAAGLQA